MYCDSDDRKYYKGVGFTTKKQLLESMIQLLKASNQWIRYITLKGQFNNMFKYVPTEDSEDENNN